MQKRTRSFKTESIIRTIIAIIGILTFNFSADFGWGFILGALISKERIQLNTKEGLGLLALILVVMIAAIYFLIGKEAVFGYIVSTIVYYILKFIIRFIQNKNTNIGV